MTELKEILSHPRALIGLLVLLLIVVSASGCSGDDDSSKNKEDLIEDLLNNSSILVDERIFEVLKTEEFVLVSVRLKEEENHLVDCSFLSGGDNKKCKERYKAQILQLQNKVLILFSESHFVVHGKSSLFPQFTGYISYEGMIKILSSPYVSEIRGNFDVAEPA